VTRLKQFGVILVGLGLAAAMVVLGLWQLEVYSSQGAERAQTKAAAPPLELTQVAPAGSAVREGFGRAVHFVGRYDPKLQVLIPVNGQGLDSGPAETDPAGAGPGPPRYLVLTGLRLADGTIVPVVRGVVTELAAPAPPSGQVDQVGVLLPSEDNVPVTIDDGTQLSAVSLPALVQRWPAPLIGGYVTLSNGDANAQGLTPAPLLLPEAKGRLRNGAYAFQWWVFGAFALALALRMAHDLGLRDDTTEDEMATPMEPGAT